MVVNCFVFSGCCDRNYEAFHPVKSQIQTGGKELKALHKHNQQRGWSCHGLGKWTVLTILFRVFKFDSK